MDRIWQWAWDRYASRYSWAICAVAFPLALPIYLVSSFVVVAYEESGNYVEAAAITVVVVLLLVYAVNLPGLGGIRLAEQWAAGDEVERASALEATYTWARGAVARAVGSNAVVSALLLIVVGAISGATGSRLVQYGIVGAFLGAAVQLTAVHSVSEAMLRPASVALAGETGIGDSMPRSRPTFAAWSDVSMLAVAFAFALLGAMLGPCSIGPVRSPCSPPASRLR
jgi:adenylate cyclase